MATLEEEIIGLALSLEDKLDSGTLDGGDFKQMKVALRQLMHKVQDMGQENTTLSARVEELAEAADDYKARKDAAYLERNRVVALLARMFPSGIAKTDIKGWDPEWHGCVYLDTPMGQLSWHYHTSQAHLFEGLPPYTGAWDGHSTAIKYDRVESLCGWIKGMSFQSRVNDWVLECFGNEIAYNKDERSHRFCEESLELVQACGCSKEEVLQLVDYVYGRPWGDIPQEVGGVEVTLNALCNAHYVSVEQARETELRRIQAKMPQIRAKQASKPKFGPLPGKAPEEQAPAPEPRYSFTQSQLTTLLNNTVESGLRSKISSDFDKGVLVGELLTRAKDQQGKKDPTCG